MEIDSKHKLSKKNSEMEKLEKSKRSQIRMISSSAARLKLKYGNHEDSNHEANETDAKSIRMYETHFPGFCYLRNGEYRKKITSQNTSTMLDSVQCSQKIKAILFTDSELDIYKTMCLHLLGTHIQNKNHIQRKDGRLCSYVKAQSMGNVPHTLQPICQRANIHSNDLPTKYDKMLPRYVLDVRMLNQGVSMPSVRTYDFDSESDEESKKKRKLQVPIYINNEIRMIVNSVMEALEAVESSKLNDFIELASSPEELRNMLVNEDLQDYIIELSSDPLVMKPTSYNYIMAHLMFDKIPEKGTLETVAQVLEVYDNAELKMSLNQIRKAISQRHSELVNSNILPRKKAGVQEKSFFLDNNYKISNSGVNSSFKCLINASTVILSQKLQEDKILKKENKLTHTSSFVAEKEDRNLKNKNKKNLSKNISRSVSINLEKTTMDENFIEKDEMFDESDEFDENKESFSQSRSFRIDSSDSTKYDLHTLTNSQRILLGLKVASLKSKPINMHQCEGKKKVDIAALINPIIRPQASDINMQHNPTENHSLNFSLPEKKAKKPTSKSSTIQETKLENLSRALLANLRLEISETENKKRVNTFMATISSL